MVKISIGIPIFNGEKFLKKRMETILSQTFTDYEIIISNNASTDNTLSICEEFVKKDSRIKIFNQREKISLEENFAFVLDKSKSEYFVWAAVDDLWDESFLQKNFNALNNNSKLVCSSGKVLRYGSQEINLVIEPNDSFLKILYKKIRNQFRPFYNLSFSGEYVKKASKCLKYNNMLFLYGLFRTEIIKKCVINYPIHSSDLIMCLKVLEFGDVEILDEVLWYFHIGGISSKRKIEHIRENKSSFSQILIPFFPLTIWCLNHFGWKFILKNLRHIVWLNTVFALTPLFLEIFQILQKKIWK